MKLDELWRWKLSSCTSTELREWEWTVDSWWGRGFLRFCSLKNFELWGIKRQKSDKERAVAIGWNAHVPPSICDPRQNGKERTIYHPWSISYTRGASLIRTSHNIQTNVSLSQIESIGLLLSFNARLWLMLGSILRKYLVYCASNPIGFLWSSKSRPSNLDSKLTSYTHCHVKHQLSIRWNFMGNQLSIYPWFHPSI